MNSWRPLLLLATVLLCSIQSSGAVHGLGGEGYSLWTGDEKAHKAPAHNCAGDHNHEGHHHDDHAAGHIHTPEEVAGHGHDEHAHGAHSHRAHSHGGHSHVAHSHGDHSHGAHSHGAHSHGGNSHSHAHGHDHAHKHDGGVSEHGRPKTLEELELEEMANYGLSAAVEEEDYKPPSTWDKLAAGLGQSSWGTWTMAMGSSLAVSLCSLICLIILPFILREGQTPSEGVVRILTGFGAGAMVGDAFLHQLPHAFNSGGAHSHGGHTHDHGHDEAHGHDHGSGGHAHSIQDLSVGLAVLVGLIVFFLVEKAVRYVEEATAKNPELANQISFQKQHSHKHGAKGHSHYDDHTEHADGDAVIVDKDSGAKAETVVKESSSTPSEGAKKRKSSKSGPGKDAAIKESVSEKEAEKEPAAKDITVTADAKKGPAVAPGSLLVLGYLNLFSDGVHNFTDGMALGAAFVHHGAVGGWSRTLFMLAHELPQEVGDFGILVRAGFSVTKALALNFLSASMAMAGTALALVVGGDASNSSIIEGFTAGGFVYIAVAGVMPDLHAQGTSGWVTVQQVSSMLAGMGVALAISLCE